jgi:membrane protein
LNDAHAGTSAPATSAFARLKAFVAELYREAKRDNVFNGAAALGFYLTLAIFPSMIVLMAAIPYLPIGHVDEAILDLLAQVLPGGTATMFSSVVAEITGEKRAGVLSLGLAGTLWAASSGMYAVMQQMNVAYDVEEGRPFLRARATALGLTLLFAVLVLGAFSLVVLGGVIQDWLIRRFGLGDGLLAFFVAFRWAVIVAALVVALSFIYYAAPNRRQRFALLSPGTLVATVLLVASSLAFKLYVTTFADYDRTYGSIGAVVVLMLWLYMVGLVMLAGAEINALLDRRRRETRRQAPTDPRATPSQGTSR